MIELLECPIIAVYYAYTDTRSSVSLSSMYDRQRIPEWTMEHSYLMCGSAPDTQSHKHILPRHSWFSIALHII
jgi:hypothetical protein